MIRTLLLIACALALAPLPAGAQALEKVKMSIAANAMNYAPYFIPVEKGYFKEEGFDIKIVKAGGGVATPAQISGEIDFNTSASSALSAMLRGAPLRIVYFPWDKTIYQIWATDPAIKTLQDLKGKAVGIQTRGDTFEIGVRIALRNAGVDPNSVSYSPLGFGTARRAAVAAKSLPVVVIAPEDVQWLKNNHQLGNSHLIYNMYPGIRMPLAGTAVRAADLAKDRNRIKRFIRAVHKGMIYASTFPEEAVQIVAKYAKRKPDSIRATYQNTMVTKTADGSISKALERQETDLRAQLIKVDKSKVPPLDKLYDFSVAREAWKELAAQGWKPSK